MRTSHVRTNHVSPTTCEKWRERDYVARQEATPHSKVRTGRFHYMFEIGLFFVFFSLGVRGLGWSPRVHPCVLEANPTVAAIFLMTELRNAQLY